MARKRVHEIAKERGLASKEVLAKLQAAGIEVTAAASSVEEDVAAKALDGGASPPRPPRPRTSRPPPRPRAATARLNARSGPCGRCPTAPPSGAGAKAGKRRRVVIDSQASRRDSMGPPPPQRPPRRRGGRRRRPFLDEPPEKGPVVELEPEVLKINSGASVREVAETLGLSSAEVIKKLMELGEMATLTQTLPDETVTVLAEALDRKVEVVSTAEEEAEEVVYEDADEDLEAAAARGHDHGPRRPRQDVAAGRDPPDGGGGGRGRWHHPAHRRVPGQPRRQDDQLHRHAQATPPSPRCAPAAPTSPISSCSS